MSGMKFSVLMSVYDKENPEYLKNALESVFNQTILPSEVVIVEDGKLNSELEKIIEIFKKQFFNIIKIVKYEFNRGLGSALHDGILECSNEIIFRMDSDDICVHNRFEKTLYYFKKLNVDIIGSNIAEYDEKMEKITGYRKVPEKHEEILDMMKKRNPLNHMTVAFKKKKVIEAGNYKKMEYFEDYYLWARMSKCCNFYNIQENLVNVRAGDKLFKRRGGKKYIKPIIEFQKELLELQIINKIGFINNLFIRISMAFVPNFFRRNLYKRFLRKDVS